MLHAARGRHGKRAATAILLAITATLTFGCSPELASFDDTYVPVKVGENYPIKVVEHPVKLTLDVGPQGLHAAEARELAGFARQAAKSASTPVVVSYASGSKFARGAASQAAEILMQQGVKRQAILVTPRDGTANKVTLAFATKVTETKPCGDWSENIRSTQFNDTIPNFGCAYQQNFAAMIANPNDLQQARPADPVMSAAQSVGIDSYYSGDWTQPVNDTSMQNLSSAVQSF